MPVTCQVCRKKIEKDTAYKITVVGPKSGKITHKYYCSEQEWLAEEARKKKYKEDKNKVYYLISDMFGYEIQNSKFFDEWAKWNKLKSNEDIYKYIRENEDYLQDACDKSFNSEAQKIMYFSAILKNSLMDFRPKVEGKLEVKETPTPKIEIDETVYEAPSRSLNKRRSLEDLEDMF